jgi:curved DNA-binding protein CbpA
MYPFTTLDVSVGCSDDEVAARYRELVLQYPPDRNPGAFAQIREAYVAIADERSRRAAELFHFDVHGRSLREGMPLWRRGRERRRLSVDDLAAAARGDEGFEKGEL